MRHSRLFVYGGGNIIQDSTSSRSLFFYLGVTLLAKWTGMKVMFFGNGIGPLTRPLNRRASGAALNRVDVITVREELSLHELASLGVTRPQIRLTADPALLVTSLAEPELVQDLFRTEGIPEGRVYVGFSVRDYPSPRGAGAGAGGDGYLEAIARAADEMSARHGVAPVFVPMEFPRDVAVTEKVLARMKGEAYAVRNQYPIPTTLGLIAKMDMMVAMRLHALIFAANFGVPVVAVEYQPKIEGFVNYIGQASAGKMENLRYDALMEIMERAWAGRAAIRAELAGVMASLREKAHDNAEIAVGLLTETEK